MYALLVCDEPDEAAILSLMLQRVGLTVTSATNLERALHSWPQRPVDMVVISLRDMSPIEQAHRVRQVTEVPLVVISSTGDEDMLCDAYEAGADLAVARPYGVRLMVGQLRALLRRSRGTPLLSLPNLRVGRVTLDPSTRTAQVNGHGPRRLTHLEFRLLYTLMIHQGQTLPTETIVERVWGYSGEGNMELVRGLISRLRAVDRSLDRSRHPPCSKIHTLKRGLETFLIRVFHTIYTTRYYTWL